MQLWRLGGTHRAIPNSWLKLCKELKQEAGIRQLQLLEFRDMLKLDNILIQLELL
jgi:hypothetical protein